MNTGKKNRPLRIAFIGSRGYPYVYGGYETFIRELGETEGIKVVSGEFGANMQVDLVNDGPVTIIIDTKNRQ